MRFEGPIHRSPLTFPNVVFLFPSRTEFKNLAYLKLDGSVSVFDRQEIVTRFNDDPSIDLLLLTTSVGGLGLNLTGADTVIFVEHDWNPCKDLQVSWLEFSGR